MSFEYNGFIHRDLEPQVRYDAEQVQLLKQADVTINENLQTVNENLQTINTEIDGKLNKPTNPSAESAVTMLADGTVGTKLLSEICGGGKFYRHDISFTLLGDTKQTLYVRFKANKDSQYSLSELASALIGEVGEYWNDISGGSGSAFDVKIYYIRDVSLDNSTLNINMTSVTEPTNIDEGWTGQILTYAVIEL